MSPAFSIANSFSRAIADLKVASYITNLFLFRIHFANLNNFMLFKFCNPMRFSFWNNFMASFFDFIGHVFGRSAGAQVIRIAAFSVVATVKQVFHWWNIALFKRISQSVSKDVHFSVKCLNGKGSISLLSNAAAPIPAFIFSLNINPFPKLNSIAWKKKWNFSAPKPAALCENSFGLNLIVDYLMVGGDAVISIINHNIPMVECYAANPVSAGLAAETI